MSRLRHVMIMASAGSGKTYALTNRFVALLTAGADPERIVALTFTRKAAGEFFDEILHKLAGAAQDPKAARKLAEAIEQPGLQPADFGRMLRRMVDAMPRLKLGTLDSFFSRVARLFALELGLAGDFEILQEHAARVERQRVLRRLFGRAAAGPDAAQTEFIEAFKRATFGTEEKQLGARLDAFLDRHQENFLAAPWAEQWGDPSRIWPGGSPWLADEIKVLDAVRELRAQLGELTDGQRMRWEEFFTAIAEWSPGAPLSRALEYVLKNTLAAWGDLCGGCAQLTFDRRKLPLNAGACRALEKLVRHLVGAELKRRLETTRGIYAVLQSYERHYHHAVRRMGRLTFADVQRLLSPGAGAPRLASGAIRADDPQIDERGQFELGLGASGAAATGDDAEERRLMLDYRLDAVIDHWLLDEFQDTSFGQWSILRNLVDEVIQDPEGRRSFFCVGDVKQAIYAWREGDPRLFREIFEHYNDAAPGTIVEQQLVASYRSGPPVIELVNAVFGSAITLAELYPGEASATWAREWRPHVSALPDRNGQAALLHAEDEAGRWETVLRLIHAIEPLERGLSCAVLVKKNDTATALADFLRHAGVAALAESDLHIATDNPLGAALLALAQAAAHPGDTLAREHVAMTPLGVALADAGLRTPEDWSRGVLGQIHAEGFERTFAGWVARVEPALAPDDAFSRQRTQEFVAAAGLFDATGSRDVDAFIAFMERHAVRPPESGAVVRVMTIHKSKGLGFDVVLVPDLQGNRIDEPREGLAVRKARDRSVEWILDLPPRLYCEQDEVLAGFLRAAEADACYENLALLYVALTRAKRACYVVTEPVGKSKSRNFPRLLADTLGHDPQTIAIGDEQLPGAWSAGDPEWFRTLGAEQSGDAGLAVGLTLVRDVPAAPVRHVARRPSEARDHRTNAGALFQLDEATAAAFGTELHALLAEVEWAEPSDAERWDEQWTRQGGDAGALAAARRCVEAPALAHVWRRPSERAEVWRERGFEFVADGRWITGAFDRVIVDRGVDGRPIAATVFDFKSDRVGGAEAVGATLQRYAPQLATYRAVVAALTGLPVGAVRAELVLTQRLEAVALPVGGAPEIRAGQPDGAPAP